MGHTCLGPLVKKQKVYKDGTFETELNCLITAESMFGDVECETKTHKSTLTSFKLPDGTEVKRDECTNYDNG